MTRPVDDSLNSPVGRGGSWGEFSATSLLPNVSTATIQTRHLNGGDLASVGNEAYVCTSPALGAATWQKVARSGGSVTTLTVTGATTVTGGVAQAVAPHGFSNWQPIAATSGTNTTPADGTHFVTSLFIPVNKTLTGVGYLIGTVGGTDKVYAALYDASGALLANSSVTSGGATVGTAAEIQTLAFTATYAAVGPAMYYVGISMNGNTARLRTVPAFCQAGIYAGSVSQTHGTVAAITEPVTFTADKAPIVFVY
jgi:hypothetical protein